MSDDNGGGSCLGCLGSSGYSLGSMLAMILSWEGNHALLWALIHGFLSWFYVIYYVWKNWSQITWL
jgi:hypothetical protein